MASTIKIILFDLGGVLVELDGPPIKPNWIDESLSYEENWKRWGNAQSVQLFESGKMGENAFVDAVIQELHLKVSSDEFIAEFTSWPQGFLPGAKNLLIALQKKFTLGYYSNTNTFHLPWLIRKCALNNYFEFCFASYEIGYFKPDPKGFEFTVSEMNVEPSEVLFIDDNLINVQGASATGIIAEQALGVDEVLEVLRRYGCLNLE